MIPPLTPLFAGRPTDTIQRPAPSYMPQLDITDSTWRTVGCETATDPSIGLRPPLASVAAITPRS